MEKQIGIIKGHRVIVKRDLNDNKAISYEVAEYMSVADFEKLQLEVAKKQQELQQEEYIAKLKLEEEAKIKAEKEAYEKKYSSEHFLIAYNVVLHRIVLGLYEDDGTFPSVLEKVRCKELSIEEAVNSNEELTFIFDNFFTPSVEEEKE